jgi:hypothetical protein
MIESGVFPVQGCISSQLNVVNLPREPPSIKLVWQRVDLDRPDAIKAELNRDTRPGRFVLTGSTRYTVLPQAAQSLTGGRTSTPT